jgi:cobalt-zinc-cadmium efflux system outer membrane protein
MDPKPIGESGSVQRTRFGKKIVVWIGAGLILVGAAGGCASSRERAAVDLWRAEAARTEAPPDTAALAVATAPRPSLRDLMALAFERNRSVAAARQDWKAALEQVPRARALPDPMLTYGYFLQSVETRVGPQKQRVGVSQSFPWFGTLGERGDAALAAAEAAREKYVAALQKTYRQVSAAYAEYYYLGSAIGIVRDNLQLLRQWEEILRSRYSTGTARFSDLIKVQVELGKLQDRVTTLEQQRPPRRARLNALLDLPADTPIAWPDSLPEVAGPDLRDSLEVRLHRQNPELKALRAMVQKESHGVSLARKSGLPSFTLGVDWVQTDPRDVPDLLDNGKDPVMAMVGVRIPLWRGKVSAGVRQAEARRNAAEATLADRSNSLATELDDALFRFDDASRKTALYRDSLVPKVRQSLDASYSTFESGQGSFLDVIDAERVLLEFRLILERARADLLEARATVDALTGEGSPNR